MRVAMHDNVAVQLFVASACLLLQIILLPWSNFVTMENILVTMEHFCYHGALLLTWRTCLLPWSIFVTMEHLVIMDHFCLHAVLCSHAVVMDDFYFCFICGRASYFLCRLT